MRAVDAAGNIGPAATPPSGSPTGSPPPCPSPRRPEASPTRHPDPAPPGTVEVAVIDELDKVHPVTGELIPAEPEGYLAANHLWDAAGRRITLQAARNEFVAFQVLLRAPSSFAVAISPAEADVRRPCRPGDPGRVRPLSDRSRPSSAHSPTRSSRWVSRPVRLLARRTKACTSRCMSRTTSRPAITAAR